MDWNTPSREFYESFGAVTKTEWIGYRLEGESLKNLFNFYLITLNKKNYYVKVHFLNIIKGYKYGNYT